ncbi:hypothetical protein [Streptomyces clavuligerus]|nr:hypothetical protein [Streptomyces clavuligerus]ANW22460.1 hypothetical protein BB341_29530 [Streptomyces clavuligerus]MBY6306979.1 hypothetical protein [Streptomyces clavuligerus]QPL67042.1 hypothetical protein I3J04_29190 [Streptomyces clavuligerus]QPL73072.1 hypothetical protein I3J05_29240 [Streptomyces clavuligerus]QPL79145.1 hypothetical protein I3J06_29155 [Streptomyces clavuligerus]
MRRSRTTSLKLSTAAATLALLTSGIAFAAPASATTATATPAPARAWPEQCKSDGVNSRQVDLPGTRPTTWITGKNCVQLHQPQAPAWVSGRTAIDWDTMEEPITDRSKRFTSFKVTTRLESRPSQTGTDTVQSSRTCDFTANLNADFSGMNLYCYALPVDNPVDTILWWSTDATIVYDLEGDTQGPITWELEGSPQQV